MAGKRYIITLTEEQLKEYKQTAKALQHEAAFLRDALDGSMIQRYAYSPSCAAMAEGAKALRQLLSAAKELPAEDKPTLRERISSFFWDDF